MDFFYMSSPKRRIDHATTGRRSVKLRDNKHKQPAPKALFFDESTDWFQ